MLLSLFHVSDVSSIFRILKVISARYLIKHTFHVKYTVEPLIAATFTAKVRLPILGGGRYSEVYYKYGKAFGTEGQRPLSGGGRYSEVAAHNER